jgi:hypothetical protein
MAAAQRIREAVGVDEPESPTAPTDTTDDTTASE